MAVEISKDSICVNQIIEQKRETVIVEGDSIIPDVKPDILSVISTSGTVCVYKKEILDGKVRIDGSIDTYIMYLAEDEKSSLRSVNCNMDFTQVIDIGRAEPGMQLETNIVLKSIECKVVNGRKVNTKAVLEFDIKVTSNKKVDIINSININDIQTLNKNLMVNLLVGTGTTKTYAKDTLAIDSTHNLEEIMKADVNIINKDTKISYNKVLTKADLSVKILYLTEDNNINSVENVIPIMGFIDIQNVTEENICDVKYELKNLIIKPNSPEEHSIYVEAEVEVSCNTYQNQELNIIQDLYSPSTTLNFTKKQIRIMQTKQIQESTCNIRESKQIPELQGNKIYDIETKAEILKQSNVVGKIMYEGELNLNFIYASNNSTGIDTKTIVLPFRFDVDFDGANATSAIDTLLEIGTQDFVVTSDDTVDIKIDLLFVTTLLKNIDINIIDDICEEEMQDVNMYSMIVYFAKPGDSLWKIAKKFGSTVEEIARINEIDDVDKIDVKEELFIPRYSVKM